MEIVLATSNPHKLDEIAAVIDDPRIAFRLLSRADPEGAIPEPVEDQPTFEGNAELKARYYAARTGKVCLADDSGLEVDALGGAPGVISARYSGTAGGRDVVDPANNRKLLDELGGTPAAQRTARFVCALCLAAPPEPPRNLPAGVVAMLKRLVRGRGGRGAVRFHDGRHPMTIEIVRGTVEGRILFPHECTDPARPEAGRGTNGFGYDPLFRLPDDHPHFPGKTTAELAPADKNSVSHRGRAARLMWEKLKPGLDRAPTE